MQLKTEIKALLAMIVVFIAFYYLPLDSARFSGAVVEALQLAKWYAREHVILCLLPAFFIAGAIAVFIGQESVMKYLGAGANKIVSYGVASVSGSILAVCSCTVLPLFAGIHRMGAGLGPATTFLYAGPAINVLAIILTARVLGLELGVARAVAAVLFSIVIGLLMSLLFRGEARKRQEVKQIRSATDVARPLWQNGLYFAAMIAILIFANWGKPESVGGFWHLVFSLKWLLTGIAALLLAAMLVLWMGFRWWKITAVAILTIIAAVIFPHEPLLAFAVATIGLAIAAATSRGEGGKWFDQTWGFTKQILPLLFYGVLVAGLLLGRPGHEGLVPSSWISGLVGGNSLAANLFASVAGALMYFATLTEIPILEGLLGSGMGKGPALALLLAGPALSLPNMLVIRSVLGNTKTLVFVALVIAVATCSGLIYGAIYG